MQFRGRRRAAEFVGRWPGTRAGPHMQHTAGGRAGVFGPQMSMSGMLRVRTKQFRALLLGPHGRLHQGVVSQRVESVRVAERVRTRPVRSRWREV